MRPGFRINIRAWYSQVAYLLVDKLWYSHANAFRVDNTHEID